MMDFEDAAQRLAKDQKKLRGRGRTIGGGNGGIVMNQKAKRQMEIQRKQQEYQESYIKSCDRGLHVKSLGPSGSALLLQPTSIYGDGDKIALPPSVLETLTSSATGGDSMMGGGNPWTFRIGILNPEYKFPASPLVRALRPPAGDEDESNSHMEIDHGSDDDDESDADNKAAYKDELHHKYLAYTHCTVVEFTQDDGYVGIPQPIASALISQANNCSSSLSKEEGEENNKTIPISRSVDPAAKAVSTASSGKDGDAKKETNSDTRMQQDSIDVISADQTPGHLAWGAFDLPDIQLEITLLKLPKGKGCTIVPTQEAIQSNFYALKDIKLVLEQSLIRTRATLSVGDIITTWHRGIKYDLNVTKVTPSQYKSVTCINTDIEVDIGEAEIPEGRDANKDKFHTNTKDTSGDTSDGGYKLGSSSAPANTNPTDKSSEPNVAQSAPTEVDITSLPPEPSADRTEGICNVQIRFSGGNGKRRFDVSQTKVEDLFIYASLLQQQAGTELASNFQLVTRFPRRVFTKDQSSSTLEEVGIQPGQELFMLETI